MRRIAAVLDPSFGERLLALAEERHVWIVESEANRPWIEKVWERTRSRPGDIGGATSFVPLPDATSEQQFLEVLDTMANHHAPGIGEIPWGELEVFGVTLGADVQDVLVDFGFVTFAATAEGFRALQAR